VELGFLDPQWPECLVQVEHPARIDRTLAGDVVQLRVQRRQLTGQRRSLGRRHRDDERSGQALEVPAPGGRLPRTISARSSWKARVTLLPLWSFGAALRGADRRGFGVGLLVFNGGRRAYVREMRGTHGSSVHPGP
jgi:hypothetical protein